jgi:hypothetical protein
MKRINKALLSLISITISNLAFAASASTMNINFVNKTADTGNTALMIFDGHTTQDIIGPIIERNGGTAEMSQPVGTLLISPGFLSGSFPLYCEEASQGYLYLNPATYQGDTITVTVNSISNTGALDCSCTGSACDFTFSKTKISR